MAPIQLKALNWKLKRPIANLIGLNLMDSYILSELIAPFLFGVGAFSSVGVSIGALFELVRRIAESGLPITFALQILLLNLPQYVAYSFPMSTLMATLMTFSRLAGDSELVALKSCGVSLYRMVMPAIFLGLVVTLVTFGFNESLVPTANYQASVMFNQALKRERPTFQQRNILYQEFRDLEQADGTRQRSLARLFYAREFNGQEMKGLTILDFSQLGLSQVVSAETAVWNPNSNSWNFYDGTIYLVDTDGSYSNIVKFEEQELRLPRAPLDLASTNRSESEMNIAEAQEYLSLLKQSGDDKKVRKFQVVIQQKYALPFACVIFSLVGAVLGARARRASRATGFGISVLIIFGYYALSVTCGAMGQSGLLSPFVAGWLPNLLGLGTGLVLLLRASR